MQFGRGKPNAGVFFDSDFTTPDSILAIALSYGLQGKNECVMSLMSCSRPDLLTVGYVELVERYYHGPAAVFSQLAAIGMPTSGDKGETPKAYPAVFDLKKDGLPLYRNEVKTVIDTGDPNTLIRNYLEAQYDQNAYFILDGPATNLARALEFRGVKDLLKAKIKYLVATERFGPDTASAKKVLADWPTPIVLVGKEVGEAAPFPGASIEKEFLAATPDNPVADAYKSWKPMPYDTPSTAMAAALYAARPKEGYFKLSDAGTAGASGKHQRLVFDPAQKDKVIAAYVELASAKPVVRQRFRPAAADAAAAAAGDPAAKPAAPAKP